MRAVRPRSERGSVSPVFLVVSVLLAGGLAAAVVSGGWRLRDRARADAVADVTALAGAVDDRSGAARVAEANGADVSGWRRADDVVIVAITLRSLVAEAAAIPVATPLAGSMGAASRSGRAGSLGLGR